jgi:hypothetical protein
LVSAATASLGVSRVQLTRWRRKLGLPEAERSARLERERAAILRPVIEAAYALGCSPWHVAAPAAMKHLNSQIKAEREREDAAKALRVAQIDQAEKQELARLEQVQERELAETSGALARAALMAKQAMATSKVKGVYAERRAQV